MHQSLSFGVGLVANAHVGLSSRVLAQVQEVQQSVPLQTRQTKSQGLAQCDLSTTVLTIPAVVTQLPLRSAAASLLGLPWGSSE